jgi:hypothetical protein
MEMEPSRFASYRPIVARGRHITLTAYRLIWNFRYDVGPRHAIGEAWTVARRLGGSVRTTKPA